MIKEIDQKDLNTPTPSEKSALDFFEALIPMEQKRLLKSVGADGFDLRKWRKTPGLMWNRVVEITRNGNLKPLDRQTVDQALLAEVQEEDLDRTYSRREGKVVEALELELGEELVPKEPVLNLDENQGEQIPERSLWAGKDLAICSPFYRTTNPLTNFALMALFDRTKMRYFQEHGTYLIRARNRLAFKFLESGCQWSLWVDDDMIPPIGNSTWWRKAVNAPDTFNESAASVNVINRLMQSADRVNGKIISSLYFGRNEFGRAMFAEAIPLGRDGAVETHRARQAAGTDKIRQTAWVAAGCMLVHRDVFVKCAEKLPKIEYSYQNPIPFFTPTVESNSGEDQAFGRLAAACGFASYVDYGVVTAHLGYNIWSSWNTVPEIQV